MLYRYSRWDQMVKTLKIQMNCGNEHSRFSLTATLDKSLLVLLGNVLDRDSIFQSKPAASMIRCGHRKRLCLSAQYSGSQVQSPKRAEDMHGGPRLHQPGNELQLSLQGANNVQSAFHFQVWFFLFYFFFLTEMLALMVWGKLIVLVTLLHCTYDSALICILFLTTRF